MPGPDGVFDSRCFLSRERRRKCCSVGKGCLKPSLKWVGECDGPQPPALRPPHPGALGRTHAIKQMLTQPFSISRALLNALQRWDNFHAGILRRGKKKKKSPTFFYITYAVGLKPRPKLEANEIRPFCVLRVRSV